MDEFDLTKKESLIYIILHHYNFILIRFLLILIVLSGFIPIFFNSFNFSCGLIIVQSVLLPFILTGSILSTAGIFDRHKRTTTGAIIGAWVGVIPAIISILINDIQYYFLGGQKAASIILHRPVPPQMFEVVFAGFLSDVIYLLVVILISTVMGILGAQILRRRSTS